MMGGESSPRRHNQRRTLWMGAILFGCIVFVLGSTLDVIVHRIYENSFAPEWWAERGVENAIEAVLAGIIAYFIILDRERRVEKRIREIRYLNHHVRNALFPLVMSQGVAMETKKRIEIIRDSSERIQRVLEKLSREEDVGDFHDDPRQP